VIPLGERHFRRTLAEFVVHYHRERNHQGLGNELIDGVGDQHPDGPVRRRQRIGGLLSYYYRAARNSTVRDPGALPRPPRADATAESRPAPAPAQS